MLKNINRRDQFLIFLFAVAAIVILIFLFVSSSNEQITKVAPNQPQPAKTIALTINNVVITAEVAETPSEITKGLSGRKSLGEKRGMYFVLGERRAATFWMKDMLFPIDIIWIDEGEIVYIVADAQPPQDNIIPRFTPPQPATHVLEVNAGFVAKYNITIGNIVKPRK